MVRKELLLAQVKNAHWMLEQIENEITRDGLPGMDFEADPSVVEQHYSQLVGELSLVAQICDSLATTLVS